MGRYQSVLDLDIVPVCGRGQVLSSGLKGIDALRGAKAVVGTAEGIIVEADLDGGHVAVGVP
jgi:hypothetical protein